METKSFRGALIGVKMVQNRFSALAEDEVTVEVVMRANVPRAEATDLRNHWSKFGGMIIEDHYDKESWECLIRRET